MKFMPYSNETAILTSLYARWNGCSDSRGGTTQGLREDRIYKVFPVNINSYFAEVQVFDMQDGTILPNTYNSVLFKPLKSYIGYGFEKPRVGENYMVHRMERIQGKMVNNCYTTSTICFLEWISASTFNIITRNSVYTIELIE